MVMCSLGELRMLSSRASRMAAITEAAITMVFPAFDIWK